jgi:hypothetical protein
MPFTTVSTSYKQKLQFFWPLWVALSEKQELASFELWREFGSERTALKKRVPKTDWATHASITLYFYLVERIAFIIAP